MSIVTFLLALAVAIGACWVAYHNQHLVPLVTAILAAVLFALLLFSVYGTDRGRTL